MKIQYNAILYMNHTSPDGILPRERVVEASACWHFCKLAHVVLTRVPEQATYEGDLDQTVSLMRIAQSVRQMYDVADMNDMMAMKDWVKAEALRCGLPWDVRLDTWFKTAGRGYDSVTREPEALNKS